MATTFQKHYARITMERKIARLRRDIESAAAHLCDTLAALDPEQVAWEDKLLQFERNMRQLSSDVWGQQPH